MKIIITDGIIDNKGDFEKQFAENRIIPFFVANNVKEINQVINGEDIDVIVTSSYLIEMDAISLNREIEKEFCGSKPLHIVYNKNYNSGLFNFLVSEGINYCVYGENFANDVIKLCKLSLKDKYQKIRLFPVGVVNGDFQIIKSLMNKYGFNYKLKGSIYFEACFQVVLKNQSVKSLKTDVYPVVAKNFETSCETVKKETEYAVKNAYIKYRQNGAKDQLVFDTPARAISLLVIEIKKYL